MDGTKCWITGFGRLASGGASPNALMAASVPVVSRARCDKAYPGKIHDSMICAGLDQGGIDSCQGDSGGPMVCESGGRFYLHGATSWGYGCASPGKFGVYAKIKHVMSWINKEMGGRCLCANTNSYIVLINCKSFQSYTAMFRGASSRCCSIKVSQVSLPLSQLFTSSGS